MTPEQLKASILQRAMEGKLVPQNPNDEPASELLKRIKAEKEKLISEGKIKRDKKETEIFRGDDGKHYEKFADGSTQEIDVPYDIPENWKWVRIKSIYWNFGQNKPEKFFRYIDTSSIDRKKNIINYKNLQYLSPEQAPSRARKLVSQNSVLFSTVRPYLKNIAVVRELKEYLIASTAFIVLDTLLNETYLKYYLLSDNFINRVNNKSTGTSYPAINDYNFNLLLIAIPPLAEQQRIVEVIESALEKVDEYAESYNRLEQLDKEFPDKLKKSILQYAMQGKLVEQDPNDESVEVLLEKIRAEKQKLFEEGKIKKKDLEISIVSQGDDNSYYLNNIKIEIDFPRRSTWLLAPLEKIVTTISAKPYQIKQSEIVKEGKIPVVSQSKILVEGFSNNFSKILDYKTDVVIFGDHTRNLKIIDFPFVVGADGVKILSPIYLSAKFLKYHLDYTLLFVRNRGYARHYSYLKSKIIGIPSVLEQKRIVAKIDLLFQKVSQLSE